MILVDASVWIGHLRRKDDRLFALLKATQVLAHPFVIGELTLTNLARRETVVTAISELPQAVLAMHAEALQFIDRHTLFGREAGYVEIHLLAAVRLVPGSSSWTRDKRVHDIVVGLSLATEPTQHRPA